MIYAD
ncbi:unnamed protein product, partial [Didymodactylos carnosus]